MQAERRRSANILQKKLGIRLYDKEGLREEAEKAVFMRDMKMFLTEEYYDSLLYAIAENYSCTQIGEIPFSQMKKIAGRQPCIILGMGANYILRDRTDLVSVFLHSDKEEEDTKGHGDVWISMHPGRRS